MAYDEKLADRVREALADIPDVEEKKMFRGVTFMVDDKMCVSVSGDELMLRLDPDLTEQLVEEPGTRPMVHGDKHMKGFIYISEERFRNQKDFDRWIKLALDYNPKAKSSKK
ncbi:TfoX/Sxy family protein [Mucilaginibacter ginsenosidivorans]|uniref:TfoX/Sxy family protein n=1 Tax=Mucilaginibacter ginsenosidivorans TaxID=398053 RepID=A0A5B8UZM2_9SPHI|nr:TfoX/Sxy family protein [Mucilaginibacter ginsenosidivorans]QEC64215.1 TfoX/Sxy family protein [Mucilaginibacter ginsenosidivorans]